MTAAETLSQRVMQAQQMRPALVAEGKRRQGLAGRKDRNSTIPKHSTRSVLARFCGLSERGFDKALNVVEAALAEPGKWDDVVEQMDQSGNVDRAYQRVNGCYAETVRILTQPSIFSSVWIGKKRLGEFRAEELAWLLRLCLELNQHFDARHAAGYAHQVFTVPQVQRALGRADRAAAIAEKRGGQVFATTVCHKRRAR